MSNVLEVISIFENALKKEGKNNNYIKEILTRAFSAELKNRKDFFNCLPKMKWIHWQSDPRNFSFFLISQYRKNTPKFFYDMISRFLIPEKHLDIGLSFSTRFSIGSDFYNICEIVVSLEDVYEVGIVKRNLPFLEKEILLGVGSSYHASKILEMKGLSIDDKTTFIQERIAAFFERFPKIFDDDVYQEMHHFFAISKESFKSIHDSVQLYRIILTLYYFRKALEQRTLKQPAKRHVFVKMKNILLYTPFGHKEVLSMFIGLNFLKEHELFAERNFISALSSFIPNARCIPHSFLVFEHREERLQTVYIEVEKENGEKFSKEELKRLKKSLPDEIHNRIEQLVPPVFMPRNEEEVMRNILTLSAQLKYLRDLPQMIATFDKQTDTELFFTVVLMRIRLPNSLSIEELFQLTPFAERMAIDRVKMVGKIRRKYPKEAAVLRIHLSSEKFLREDCSVDLFRARLSLVHEIQKIVGEVRDFNGGMISKQSENYLHLKNLMGEVARKHALLLQNYFHAIFPAHLSTTLDAHLLKIHFTMLTELMESNKESMSLVSKKANDFLFVVMKFQDLSWKLKVLQQIETLHLSSNELLSIPIQVYDLYYLGFVYLNPDQKKQKVFLETISEAMTCSV